MSEKRNLVHWSILALRDCKLPLTSVRHFFGKSQPEKFVVLCLLLVHREPVLASCFSFSATNNPGKGVPARLRKNDDRHGTSYPTPEKPFPLSVIQNTENWQPDRQKIFLFTLNTTALPVLPKMGAKKQ